MMLLRTTNLSISTVYKFAVAKPNKEKTYYQLLQVPSNATPTTIKKNYLKLAKIYHPDVYKGADKTRFQKIQEAYKTLSNQGERSLYDEKIGIKATHTEYDQEPTSSSGTTNVYGKSDNDFAYTKPKVQINIDEQYEKFFKKKSRTHFEDIRLHEQNEFKAMSEQQRIRRRFKQVYTNPNLNWKMQYSKSYKEILDDQINQKNVYEQQIQDKRKKYEQKYSEQGIKKQIKLIKLGGVLITCIMMPFFISLGTKLHRQREIQANYQEKIQTIFENMDQHKLKSRMKYD